jgi:DNA-binding XRE family transcriptional regulator
MPKGIYDRKKRTRKEETELGTLMDLRGFKETYKQSTRGFKRGQQRDFASIHKGEEPRTPFEALRFKLKMTQIQWADCLQTSGANISAIDRGRINAAVPLAKRMQEEARIRGIAVTLDELYQHVVPYRLDDEAANEQ